MMPVFFFFFLPEYITYASVLLIALERYTSLKDYS